MRSHAGAWEREDTFTVSGVWERDGFIAIWLFNNFRPYTLKKQSFLVKPTLLG